MHHILQPVDILDAVAAGMDLFDGTLATTATDDGQALDLRFDAGDGVASAAAPSPWPRPLTLDLWRVEHEVGNEDLIGFLHFPALCPLRLRSRLWWTAAAATPAPILRAPTSTTCWRPTKCWRACC